MTLITFLFVIVFVAVALLFSDRPRVARGLFTVYLILVAFALVACGNTVNNTTTTSDAPVAADPPNIDRWSASLQKAYMGGCTSSAGVSKEQCICTLEWLERRYTAEEAISGLDAGTLDYEAAAGACPPA